mmetsp:Transcript_7965/g.26671  ORF Transcript_7965/g.26671 Transcript_7965/m.26671 type:complete len:105 (-) Transcript_7965:300-614(-)
MTVAHEIGLGPRRRKNKQSRGHPSPMYVFSACHLLFPHANQIWQIREMFARCFGYAFLVGITIIILACCFNLRGCYIYDKFIDKEKPNLNEEEETILPGDSSRN